MEVNLKHIMENSSSVIEFAYKEDIDLNYLLGQIISELNPDLFVIPSPFLDILKQNNQWNYNVVDSVYQQEDFIKETLTKRLKDFGGELVVFVDFTEPFKNEFTDISDLQKRQTSLNDVEHYLNELAESSKSKIILLNKLSSINNALLSADSSAKGNIVLHNIRTKLLFDNKEDGTLNCTIIDSEKK